MFKFSKIFYILLYHTMSGLPSSFIAKKSNDGTQGVSYISRIVPVANGNKIFAGDSIHFRFGALQKNQFLDCENSFFKYRLTNNSSVDYHLPKCGTPGMFRSIVCQQAGSTLSNFQEYGIYRNKEHFKNATETYLSGAGNTLLGTKDASGALVINSSYNGRAFCDPIKHHSSLFNSETSKYVPMFSRDAIELIYEIGDQNYGGWWDTTDPSVVSTIQNSDLEFSDVELVLCIVQLAPEATDALTKLHNGMYVFETVSYGVNQFTIQPSTAQSLNLGLGYTNLEKLEFVMLPQTDNDGDITFNKTTNDMRGSFLKCNLSKYAMVIDGSLVEATRQVSSSTAEALVMSMIANNELKDIYKVSNPYLSVDQQMSMSIDGDTGITQYNGIRDHNGAYIGSLDLCIYKNGKQGILCSGRNVLSASTQIQTEFSPTTTQTINLVVFASYRQLLALDLSGSGSGLYSVLQ